MTAHELPPGRTLLAVTAGLLLIAGPAGCGGDSDGSPASKSPPSSTTQPSDALHTIAEWDEQDGDGPAPMEPGTYRIPASPWSVTDFTVAFPEGWTSQYGHVYATNSDEPDELGFYAVVVDEIFTDSCAREDESTQAVGPHVDDLYAALRKQAGGAAVSQPVRTTLGGYPATRIDLAIPKHVDVARCRLAPAGLQIWYSEPADKYFVLLRDATASVYVVDLDGQRQVFLTQVGNAASATDRAELQTVLDSIRITPSPTTGKSQSPQTWVDAPVAARPGPRGWAVPDPFRTARAGWFTVVAEHLDPTGGLLAPQGSDRSGGRFERPIEGSMYPSYGRFGLIADQGGPNLFDDGCGYLRDLHDGYPDARVLCTTKRFEAPGGEPARISSWDRRCGAYEGPSAPPDCGVYVVGVAVERPDGLRGFVVVDGRGTPDLNPFSPAALAAAAADPRMTLPDRAFEVPSDRVVQSVIAAHFPRYEADDGGPATDHPGHAWALGRLGRRGLSVQVWPAAGTPRCGRDWVIDCVGRRVYGADDPTTVYVGAWDEEEWASCCPRNSRANSREFVYVGPRHTVLVSEFLIVREGEDPISTDLDQRLIDLALDPLLQ